MLLERRLRRHRRLDEGIRTVEQTLGSNREVAKVTNPRFVALARRHGSGGAVVV